MKKFCLASYHQQIYPTIAIIILIVVSVRYCRELQSSLKFAELFDYIRRMLAVPCPEKYILSRNVFLFLYNSTQDNTSPGCQSQHASSIMYGALFSKGLTMVIINFENATHKQANQAKNTQKQAEKTDAKRQGFRNPQVYRKKYFNAAFTPKCLFLI